MESPSIATYPSAKGRGEIKVHLPQKKKTRGSRHQLLLEENVIKKPKRDMRILKIRVRESFTHEEGISTPRVRHKGRQPLIECAKHDFKIIYFSLLYFYFIF